MTPLFHGMSWASTGSTDAKTRPRSPDSVQL